MINKNASTTKLDLWYLGLLMLEIVIGKNIHEICKNIPAWDEAFPEKIFE
jgi:hypothetical protein